MNYPNQADLDAISSCLRSHSSVEDAIATVEEITPNDRLLVVYVVPDKHRAGEIRRACELEIRGCLKNSSLYEPDRSLLVAQKNRRETDFLYQEIFVENSYLNQGIQLTEKACVVDIGANIGMFAIFVAKQCSQARVISIEPVAELCEIIKLNAQIHNINLTVLNCALGSKPGFSTFTYYPNNTVMSSLFADELEDQQTLRLFVTREESIQEETLLDELVTNRIAGQSQECTIMTLNQVVEQEKIQKIDLLKIDVEKAEMDVLVGINENTWAKIAQIVIEVHDIEGRVDKVQKMLFERGFIVSCKRSYRLAKTNCFTISGYLKQSQSNNPKSIETSHKGRWLSRQSLIDNLLEECEVILQKHKIPHHFVWLDTIPLTADKKPDFDQLQRIRIKKSNTVHLKLEPQTPTEKSLAKIWCEILSISNVTLESDFFELGSNSLTALRLLARINEIFGENVLSLDALFENGQLGTLAAIIDSAL